MPFKSQKQERWAFATGQPFAKKWASMTNQKTLKKKKPKIIVNNKLKGALGSSEFTGKGKKMKPTGKIEINVTAHKGDKKELASTIKHEMMHVKNPKMTEKEVYKRTAKTKISPQEQSKLLVKLRHKKLNYKVGAVKRKFKMSGDTKPGDLISKMNESKISRVTNNSPVSQKRISILGLV